MKIYTKIVYEWEGNALKIVESESFDYQGAIASCDPIAAIFSTVAPILTGLSAMNSLMSTSAPAPTPTPTPTPVTPPTVMPDLNAAQPAKKRQMAAATQGNFGRTDTIMTDKLGG